MSRNPFLSPTPTGQSTVSLSSYAPPPGPPPPNSTRPAAAPPPPTVSVTELEDAAQPAGDAEGPIEPPPPYTPTPSRWEEETVQYGPRRPFQPAPPPLRPIPSFATRPNPEPQFIPPPGPPPGSNNSGPSWQPPASRPDGPPPPPRHPSTLLSPGEAPIRRTASSASAYRPPPGPPPSQSSPMPGSYPPPPGPPPSNNSQQPSRRRSDAGRGNGGGSTSSPAVPKDGKPTKKPVPGHPLMMNGQVLVYPSRYTCHKCLNLGYKNFDLNNFVDLCCQPRTIQCWEKYSRPYEGALVYADWTDRSTNFQRPLPENIRLPEAPRQRPASSQYPGQSPTSPRAVITSGPPPPGALVVLPGDPRIGGRLCYNCGGAGSIPTLFFGDETCPVCRGSGRVF